MASALAKRAVAGLVRALPMRVRKGLLRELCGTAAPRDAYAAFQQLGRRFGITDVLVPGDYGEIEGALADTAILATYAQTRRWSVHLAQVASEFFADYTGGSYLDIGANIGLTTIPVARQGTITCKAFEPEPRTFRYLVGNLRRNCAAGNVETFNLALSDRSGTIAFELADDNLGDNRIRLTDRDGSFGEAARRVITVPTDRLDDVLRRDALDAPIAVKLDIQGAECRALAGGRAVLDEAALFTCEFWPYGIRRLDSDPEQLVAFVAERFASGAILEGEREDAPIWQPIAEIVDRLRQFARAGADAPYATCELLARK